MDTIKETRKAYVAGLASIGITAYDTFLPDLSGPETYVVVSSQSDTDKANKCGNGHITNITLDIIHRTLENSGSAVCDDVAYSIISMVKAGGLTFPSGMDLVFIRKTQDFTTDGLSDTHKIYRRILTFENTIKN